MDLASLPSVLLIPSTPSHHWTSRKTPISATAWNVCKKIRPEALDAKGSFRDDQQTRQTITEFCQRWRIAELALFGSVLRADFRPDSDVDVLVTFAEAARWSLLDHIAMEEELSQLLGRKVDLVSRRAIERSKNWVRRDAILSGVEPIYASR